MVPGFSGLFLDPNDNAIVYVYMADSSQQEAAEEAARIILGRERFEQEIREVRVLQAQYSMRQLSTWYNLMRDAVWSVAEVSWTDLNEGNNRIEIRMLPRPGARQEMEAALAPLNIPENAVVIEVGCPDVGQQYEPPPFQPEDPTLRSIRLWVEVPAQVKAGQSVPLVLRVKNVGDRPVTLRYGEGHDFVVTRPDGGKVWQWGCQRGVITQSKRTMELEPGQEFAYETVWIQWDNEGEPVPPGEYLVYGVFDVYPNVPTPPQTFTIVQ